MVIVLALANYKAKMCIWVYLTGITKLSKGEDQGTNDQIILIARP